jgi:hypothetical protein
MTVFDFHIMSPIAGHVRVKAESLESGDEWCEFPSLSVGIGYMSLGEARCWQVLR